ncbi:MAG: DUF433 domain-containing protein [Sphingobacteriaceae bacterium]|nr:DUF433 domain-containing protein [Cytophagaceae bacterium]
MEAIVSDPDIMGGTPVFRGTRVAVKTLFDYLLSGVSDLQDFLEDYPSVRPDDARRVLEAAAVFLTSPEKLAA